MTYHLIGRADQGGLAQQTVELARHVPPGRTLIVDLGDKGRGATRPGRYTGDTRVTDGMPTEADWDWITDGAHTLFAAETAYRATWCEDARARGIRTVLQANPELYGGDRPDALTLPTDWEAARIPDAVVLPVPVARDLLPPRPPEGTIRCWYHPAAPAMMDRNGTQIVLAALRLVTQPVTVILRSGDSRERTRRIGAATLIEVGPVTDYPDGYPNQAQGLLLPRRYGGLCLPMAEAASLGWPILSLDLAPQRSWLPAVGLIPARRAQERRMVGGDFWVHDGAAGALAALIDRLAVDADTVAELRDRSLVWAETLDWTRWVGEYRRVLA